MSDVHHHSDAAPDANQSRSAVSDHVRSSAEPVQGKLHSESSHAATENMVKSGHLPAMSLHDGGHNLTGKQSEGAEHGTASHPGNDLVKPCHPGSQNNEGKGGTGAEGHNNDSHVGTPGKPQSDSHVGTPGDHHSSAHPGSHGDHHNGTHAGSHGDHHNGTHAGSHGDHHNSTHPSTHGDHHNGTHSGSHGDHHNGTHSGSHGDHHNSTHSGSHGDHHNSTHSGSHGDHHNGTHSGTHGDHHDSTHSGSHGDRTNSAPGAVSSDKQGAEGNSENNHNPTSPKDNHMSNGTRGDSNGQVDSCDAPANPGSSKDFQKKIEAEMNKEGMSSVGSPHEGATPGQRSKAADTPPPANKIGSDPTGGAGLQPRTAHSVGRATNYGY